MTVAPLAVGVALALLAWSRILPLSGLLLAVLGGGALIGVNATNAMLQQSVPDEWRGRVIGLYSMSFAGTAPLGGLLSGWLAEHIGLTATLTPQRRSSSSPPACSAAGACTTTPRPCAASCAGSAGEVE